MKNFALKLVNEIILYYDARSKKYQITTQSLLGKLGPVNRFDFRGQYN